MKPVFIHKACVFLLFFFLLLIPSAGFMLSKNAASTLWESLFYGSCLLAFACGIVAVFFRPSSSEALRLDYKEQKLNEDKEALLLQQQEHEEKWQRLNEKERQLKQKLMQYHQFAEFPKIPESGEMLHQDAPDAEIAQLLHNKAEIIFDKIINKKYMEREDFKYLLLIEDVVDLIESVARIHHPDSEHPLLETSTENLLRALNRLSLQLLLLVDGFPVNIKEYNLRKTYFYIQKSAMAAGYYKKAEPFLSFAAPVLRVGLASHPVIGVAHSVAIEAGKQVIKKSSEKYALTLLHDVIEIIGSQAATIFGDDSARYRNRHWIHATEISEIIHRFAPVSAEALEKALRIIGGLPLPNEYDRIFLYHCLAQGKTAHPEKFAHDFLDEQSRRELADSLKNFVEDSVNKNRREENNKKALLWRKELERRLHVEISLNLDRDDSDYLKNMLSAGSPEKKIKPFLARYILELMTENETPQFIYTDIFFEPALPLQADHELYLIGSNKRLTLLAVDSNDSIEPVWEYRAQMTEPLIFQRIGNILTDNCRISGGTWRGNMNLNREPEFIIKGKSIGSYDSHFQALKHRLQETGCREQGQS